MKTRIVEIKKEKNDFYPSLWCVFDDKDGGFVSAEAYCEILQSSVDVTEFIKESKTWLDYVHQQYHWQRTYIPKVVEDGDR